MYYTNLQRMPLCKSNTMTVDNQEKNPWNDDNTDTKPGDLIYVDQMVSPKPGFIGQLTGILTRKIYKYAKLFEDQYSGLGYMNLQKTATADETIQAKKVFEAYCNKHGVAAVMDYYTDNGIFRSHKWVDECRNNEQRLTFYGVNAHHIYGLTERRIRSLQD